MRATHDKPRTTRHARTQSQNEKSRLACHERASHNASNARRCTSKTAKTRGNRGAKGRTIREPHDTQSPACYAKANETSRKEQSEPQKGKSDSQSRKSKSEPQKAKAGRELQYHGNLNMRAVLLRTLAHTRKTERKKRRVGFYADGPRSPARRRVIAPSGLAPLAQAAQAAYATPAPAGLAGGFASAFAAANLNGTAASFLGGITIPLTSAAARMLRDLGLWTSSSGSRNAGGSSSAGGSSRIAAASFSSGNLSDYRRAFDSESQSVSDSSSVGGRCSGSGGGDSDSQSEYGGSPVPNDTASDTASDEGSEGSGAEHCAAEYVPPHMPTIEPSSGAGSRRDGETDMQLNRELHF